MKSNTACDNQAADGGPTLVCGRKHYDNTEQSFPSGSSDFYQVIKQSNALDYINWLVLNRVRRGCLITKQAFNKEKTSTFIQMLFDGTIMITSVFNGVFHQCLNCFITKICI